MTSRTVLSNLLFLSCLMASGAAFAQDEAPPPPQVMDNGIGDTSVGDKTDVGAPDPLNALEDKKAQPIEEPAMPEFKDVNAAPETPPPAAPEPESAKPKAARKQVAPAEPIERSPDAPNFRREQAFHGIYKKYNAQPTPLEAWEQASAARRSEAYRVQKGDTLWDLSSTLFGDANYWPKVWALNNDEVYNPHEIDTWMQIRFFPGDLNEPPTLAVAEAAPKAAATANDADAGLIPPPKKSQPIVRKLPKSIPLYRMGAVSRPPLDFEGVRPALQPAKARASLIYQVSESAVKGIGEVKETELGVQSASEYQYVFVQVDDDSDRVLLVVRDVGTLKASEQKNAPTAHLIEVQGEIELIEKVNDNVYRAIVRKNLSSVEVGSRLVKGRIETVATDDGTPTSGPLVQLIGAQFGTGRNLADFDGFVFMNGGSSAGLTEGMILPVHADRRLRNAKTSALYNDRHVANVRIVKVTDHFATGYVTKMWDDVAIGDSVGGGASAAAAAPLPSSGSALDFEDEAPPAPTKANSELNGNNSQPADRDSEVLPADEAPADDDLSL